MPPQDQTSMPAQPRHLSVKTMVIIGAALLILGAIAVFLSQFPATFSQGTVSTSLPFPKSAPAFEVGSIGARITEIARLKAAGQYVAAVDIYREVMYAQNTTPDQRARATLYVSWARYNHSGNTQDLIYDIEEMKKHALNEEVNPKLRTLLINAIGSAYGSRNSAIFDAIYSGPTFGKFRVEGDGTLSGKNLFEWSYSVQPSAQAAVRIARWYIETSLFQKPVAVSKAEVASRREVGAKYLREAKALDDAERERYVNFEDSTDHMQFMYWYALESGYIARIGETSFKTSYQEAWADYFAEAEKSEYGSSSQRKPYAHYFFANALFKVSKDVDAAKIQLDMAVDTVNSDTNPKANQFTEFVRNGGIWEGEIAYMRGISSKFDAFLDSAGK